MLKEQNAYNEVAEKQRWKEQVEFAEDQHEKIQSFRGMALDLMENPEVADYMIVDGIGAQVDYEENRENGSFRFHSPDTRMRSYKFMKHFFAFCVLHFKTRPTLNYLEAQAISFGFSSS